MTCPISHIDTNQGIYGLGEVCDGARRNHALMPRSFILNENPCTIVGDRTADRMYNCVQPLERR